jgi:hypothetical protein
MFTAMLSVVLTMQGYQPADFVLEIKANTEVAVFLGKTRLVPGRVYRTSDRFLIETQIEVEVRYINGEEVIKRTISLPLVPGRKSVWTIELDTNPPTLFIG